MSKGLIIGKFMPPTMGHKYLIDFGRAMCPVTRYGFHDGYPIDGLDIVVGYHDHEPVAGTLRAKALIEHYGSTVHQVYPFENTLYDDPKDHPHGIDAFWRDWIDALKGVTGQFQYDYVFAAESYGERLAKEFGAQFIPVDVGRRNIPISASMVRSSIMFNWDYILPEFRKNYVKKVVITGPESCGKTTLCRDLAKYFKTEWCPEWARTYLETQNNRYPNALDYPLIARAHAAAEDALMQQANKVLICDTDAMATKIAARVLNDYVDRYVDNMAILREPDLTIIMSPDVPYVSDPLRYGITKRDFTVDDFTKEYDKINRPYFTITGDWQTRFQDAAILITRLLA